MFGRKNKIPEEQGRGARRVEAGGRNPAFSYYNNRGNATPERHRNDRVKDEKQPQTKRVTRSRLSQLPMWLLLGLGVVCAAKILLLSTNPKVIVLGTNSVSEHYVEDKDVYAVAAHRLLASSLTSHTKLTIDLNGTARALQSQFPELQNVSLTLPLMGSRPIVYAQLAQPSMVLQTPGTNYALNANGVVLAKVQGTPAGSPLVVDQSGLKPQIGKQLVPSSTVAFIRTVAYQLKSKQLPTSAFVLPSGKPYELDVRLENEPFVIRYNLTSDSMVQSGATVATLQQLGNDSPAEYLDVRVPGRVYYK
jgi:hypothetical protein